MGPILWADKFLPQPTNYILGENYGIISMLPFLFLYALPTVLIFSAIFFFLHKNWYLK